MKKSDWRASFKPQSIQLQFFKSCLTLRERNESLSKVNKFVSFRTKKIQLHSLLVGLEFRTSHCRFLYSVGMSDSKSAALKQLCSSEINSSEIHSFYLCQVHDCSSRQCAICLCSWHISCCHELMEYACANSRVEPAPPSNPWPWSTTWPIHAHPCNPCTLCEHFYSNR